MTHRTKGSRTQPNRCARSPHRRAAELERAAPGREPDWCGADDSLARRYHPQARRTHLIEQDQPFDADEVVAKAEKWADSLKS